MDKTEGTITGKQLEQLYKMLNERVKTIKVKSVNDIDWNEIAYDGHGYVILRNGTRVEFEEEA